MGRIKNFKAETEVVGEFRSSYTKKYIGNGQYEGIVITIRISRIDQNGGSHYNNILTVEKDGRYIHTKINNWISNLSNARTNRSHMVQNAISILPKILNLDA